MKIKQLFVVFLFCLTTSLFLGACSKNDLPNANFESPGENFAGLSVFNGNAYADGLDFYVDQKQINVAPDLLTIGEFMSYRTLFPGKRQISITADKNSSNFLMNQSFNFVGKSLYSLFFYGIKEFKYMMVTDDLSFPKAGASKVRFANLLDEQQIHIEVRQGNTQQKIVLNQEVSAFKDFSNQRITVKMQGTAKGAESLELFLDPNSQSIYTVCFYQKMDAETNKLGLHYYIIKY